MENRVEALRTALTLVETAKARGSNWRFVARVQSPHRRRRFWVSELRSPSLFTADNPHYVITLSRHCNRCIISAVPYPGV